MLAQNLRGKRAAVYARFSSDQQDSMSIDGQLAQIRAFADGHEILLNDKLLFRDDAVSGQQRSRDGLDRMLAAARESPRPMDIVLVYSWSRLARGRNNAFDLKRQIRTDLGLELISVSEFSDPNSTAGLITEGMHELMDEVYVRKLADDTRRGKRQAATEGYWNGGPAPFGYRRLKIDDRRGRTIKGGEAKQRSVLEIDEVRAEVVRRVFRLTAEGQGQKAIAKLLNAEGAFTPTRSKSWGPTTIREILRNPVYVGRPGHGRRSFQKASNGKRKRRDNPVEEVLHMEQPELRIVPEEDWAAVQRRIADHSRTGTGKSKGRRMIPHLFSGLIRCGAPSLSRPGEACGATFIAQKSTRTKDGKTYSYTKYVCGHRYNRGKHVCDSMTVIDEDKLALQILDVLQKDLYSEENIRRLVAMTRDIVTSQVDRSADLRHEIMAEVAQLDREIGNFTKVIAAGGGAAPELALEVRTRSERKATCQAQMVELQRLLDEDQQLDGLEAEVRARIEDTLAQIRDTGSAGPFQEELRHHVEAMTALPTGLLKIEGRLVGALPMSPHRLRRPMRRKLWHHAGAPTTPSNSWCDEPVNESGKWASESP